MNTRLFYKNVKFRKMSLNKAGKTKTVQQNQREKESIKMRKEMMRVHDIIVSFECQDLLAKQSLRRPLG